MRGRIGLGLVAGLGIVVMGSANNGAADDSLFKMPEKTETRWSSFENPTAAKGAGGAANEGAKGAAFAPIPAGETATLLDIEGSGTIRRMWFTLNARGPDTLRALRFRCYWDGAEQPAVDVPFGDFFGAILGEMREFDAALFSNPEGRSLNATVPMPFRTAARITITNESEDELRQLYYDINLTINEEHSADTLYFHATWRRERWTNLGEDFTILPKLEGRGRFLGTHIGIIGHPDNVGWWGEGEVKMYLDGDAELPTLIGTGTEDYVGAAYGQGEFANRYQGSLIVDNDRDRYAFYRYHIPDPVYFHEDIRVTIQQMGGSSKQNVQKLLREGVEVTPVSVFAHKFFPLLEMDADLDDIRIPEGWTNMYRRDDVCATALFYLDRSTNGLPPLADVDARVQAVAEIGLRP